MDDKIPLWICQGNLTENTLLLASQELSATLTYPSSKVQIPS